MKNQNDLIISIVAIVLALIIAGVCFGTKREPSTIAAPEKVVLTPPVLPQGDVVMASALPGGSGSGSGAPGSIGAAGGGMGASGRGGVGSGGISASMGVGTVAGGK